MGDGTLVMLGCGLVAGAVLWIRDRMKVRRFIRLFQRFQQLSLSPATYKVVTGTEDEKLFARITQEQADEVARHAEKLGDVVMRQGDIPGAIRVFVDEARTTLIYILVLESSVEINVESYTEEAELRTRSGTRNPWVYPPFHFSQTLPPEASVRDLIEAHSEFVKQTAQAPLLRFDSAADAIRAWVQIQQRTIAWRAAQPPDELHERDMNMMFGAGYKRLWARVRTKLRAPIPKAATRKAVGRE